MPSGVARLVVAEAVLTRASLDRLREAMPGAHVVVCRLTASIDTMQRRVGLRDPGMLRKQFLERVVELEEMLVAAQVEDFTVDNDGRSVTDVARDVTQLPILAAVLSLTEVHRFTIARAIACSVIVNIPLRVLSSAIDRIAEV